METNDHIQKDPALNSGRYQQVKKLEISASITLALGILSAIGVLLTYLALCDIANHEPDQTLEWYMVGIGLIIWGGFTFSALVTSKLLFSFLRKQSKPS